MQGLQRLLGAKESPQVTANKETETSVLQLQGARVRQSPAWAENGRFPKRPYTSPSSQHLNFGLGKPTAQKLAEVNQTFDLQNCEVVSLGYFKATDFMVVCFGSNRKLVHHGNTERKYPHGGAI